MFLRFFAGFDFLVVDHFLHSMDELLHAVALHLGQAERDDNYNKAFAEDC